MNLIQRLLSAGLLMCCVLNVTYAQHVSMPSVSAHSQNKMTHEVSLAGRWGFVWQQWPELQAIHNLSVDFDVVTLPSFMREQISQATHEEHSHGIATYFKQIEHLPQFYERPAIHMRSVSEAWQAWWIDERGRTSFLGGSGALAESAEKTELRDQTYILELPNDSYKGILVVYLSAFHFDRTGLYGNLYIAEYSQVLRSILVDLASRAFLIGIGLFVVIQNLVFYLQRRQETSLLLLSIFGFVGLLRSSFASGYVDYFVTDPGFSFTAFKFEYLLVIWPGVAALHYLTSIFPNKLAPIFKRISYSLLLLATLCTVLLPTSEVSKFLVYYQMTLLVVTAGCVWIIVSALRQRAPHSIFFLRSIFPLIIAIFNDIYAAMSPSYSFYVSEYALFLFLFFQTQMQASRFVSALDTAEHLSKNLQREVERKTAQLSKHNLLLEEKALHLEEQHCEIKRLSETDHLTGLYNRQSLESQGRLLFRQAQTYQQPVTVVMMDLDHFKEINDEFGHHVGDECLVYTASYLRGLTLRKRDIIARYGGEEFVFILTDTSMEQAFDVVVDICKGLSKTPVEGEHPPIRLSASFGLADLTSTQAKSIEALIQCADQAMYLAKKNGRNRVEAFQPKSS